ncbi:MAG: SMC family ATPase, partial [Acidobacteria bacterium]
MRPLELVIEGFRSFGERTVFDWRGRRLVGIVGPIGSGKSSILDAIAFALYGKTPVFERESKALIKQDADHLRVALTFEVDGRRWRVLRVVRRRGASQHALYRLEGDAEPPPVCERERQVSARIERLLGLDFAAFNRSVMLAQNRFARFLHAPPGERDKVLKGVIGLGRVDDMQALAKQRRQAAELAVKGLEGQLHGVEEDRRRLVEARRVLAASTARAERLDGAAGALRQLLEEQQEAERQAHAARSRLAEIDQLSVRLPAADEIDACLDAAREAGRGRRAAEDAQDAARRHLAACEDALAETVAEVGSAADQARAAGALDRLETSRRLAAERRRQLEALAAEIERLAQRRQRAA